MSTDNRHDPPGSTPLAPPPAGVPTAYQAWSSQRQTARQLGLHFRRVPPATTALVVLIICVHVVSGLEAWQRGEATLVGSQLGSRPADVLIRWGAKDAALVSGGAWWRLLGSALLHGGPMHLGLNMLALFGLGRVCEALYGPTRLLWLFVFTGITGAGLSQLGGVALSVGASGAVFGLMGAGVTFRLRHGAALPPGVRSMLGRGLAPWIVLNLFIGFSLPGIDNLGHLGGLMGGVLLAMSLGNRVIAGYGGTPRSQMSLAFAAGGLMGWTLGMMALGRLFGLGG